MSDSPKEHEAPSLPKGNEALKAAAAIAKAARVASLSMASGSFEEIKSDQIKHTESEIGANFSRSIVDSTLAVTVSFDYVAVRLKNSEEENGQEAEVSGRAFCFKAVYHIAYDLDPEASYDEKTVECFARINSVYNLWPYYREFVHTSVSRMGLPPLVMPLLTVQLATDIAGLSPTNQGPDKD